MDSMDLNELLLEMILIIYLDLNLKITQKNNDEYNDLTELPEYNLQQIFLQTIQEEADKADMLDNPMNSYRVMSDFLGK